MIVFIWICPKTLYVVKICHTIMRLTKKPVSNHKLFLFPLRISFGPSLCNKSLDEKWPRSGLKSQSLILHSSRIWNSSIPVIMC